MLTLHLQLFAEGAEGAGAEGAQAAEAGRTFDHEAAMEQYFGIKAKPDKKEQVAAAPQAEEQPTAEAADDRASVAGTQEQGRTADPAAEINRLLEGRSPEELDGLLDELVKGSLKDSYGRRAQAMINDRFPKARKAEAELAAYKAAVGPLLEKYGLEPDDVAGLKAAAETDKTNFAAAALKNGTTAEQEMKAYAGRRAKKEAAEEEKARNEEIARRVEAQKVRAQMDRWNAEEAELKKTYPDFNFREELAQNPEFAEALRAGLPMRFAYQGAHGDELLAKVAGSVAQQAALSAAQSIAANSRRPSETGIAGGAAAPQTVDYAGMSDREFMSYLKSLGY